MNKEQQEKIIKASVKLTTAEKNLMERSVARNRAEADFESLKHYEMVAQAALNEALAELETAVKEANE